jgi:glycosyltransferase involved in cell wall biosynthesis
LHADDLNAATHFLIAKSMRAFNLKKSPSFLPNPCRIPERKINKSRDPMVCFLARLDPVKRPETFFRLAKDFPNVKFVVMGQSTNPSEHKKLLMAYEKIPNLTFKGWTFGEQKSSILEQSWILVNTSIHEGLPNAFLEAWAHQCAVLSSTNPDNLVARYGYYSITQKMETLQQV